jgi:hypothetical protein
MREIQKGKIPQGAKTPEQAGQAKLKSDLRSAKATDSTEFGDKLQEALTAGKLNKKDVRQIQTPANENPLVRGTKQFSAEEMAKVIRVASADERKVLIPIYKQKFLRTVKQVSPAARKQMLETLKEINSL